jgi:quercetin dioxygenase-like cupin family protein
LAETAFFGEATFNTIPARFSLNQLIIDFRPGAGSGAHSHPAGQGLVIVMAGEGRQRLLTGDVIQKVGDVFVDTPNRAVSHENNGSQTMTVVVSYVFAAGPPAALPASIPGVPALVVAGPPGASQPPVGAPAASQPPAIRAPATGDAGLRDSP